jgi:hypothetical protein
VEIRRAYPEDAALIDQLLERAYPTLMAAAYSQKVLAGSLPAMTKANPELLR